MGGGDGGDCRPLGFLIGLPLSVVALIISLTGVIVWIIGTIMSCIFPCCICLPALANFALSLIKLPLNVINWFTKKIPC
ncbi:hypothetical protein ZOSMA_159G00090 [Zostera marina]|uniref:Uncharacterized protein n=1 Tax=Zostera marina TaxID=29655 RepID=A0A0K9PX85_ZOSMR|nr:hypothetical protein ZOSMA_159G00090 [Zostera marina]